MTLKELQPGITVYDCHKTKMGNTTLSSYCIWQVRIIDVDRENETCTDSWNGNPATRFYKRTWSKWKKERPVLVGGLCKRPATKKEIQALKESGKL